MSSDRTAALIGLAVVTIAARAQADGPDAVASELFLQGRTLIKQGKWDEGCPKLEASMKRFAAASTQLNLALCAEQRNKVATAWAMARRARVLNRETAGERRRQSLDKVAQELIDRLEPRLSRLQVVVLPKGVEAHVTEDGGEIPVGVAVPLDPGDHQLRIEARGREVVTRDVTLEEGQTRTIEVMLPEAPPPPAPAPKPVPPSAPSPAPPPAPPIKAEPSADSSPPVWPWITGGVGLAFAGLSIGFGVNAVSIANNLEERCGADLVCDEDLDFDPAADNRRKNVSTGVAIGFGAGGAIALTVAVVGLVLDTREAPSVVGWASTTGGGLGYRGAF